jgi:uncharacterized protein YkwD
MRPVLLRGRGLVAVLAISMLLATVPAARAAGPRVDRGEAAIVRALNRVRARYQLPRLRLDARLGRAADLHTHQMLSGDYFAHGAFASRVHRFVRSRAVAETLAYLPRNRCRHRRVRRVVGMWMNSAPHRAIVLTGDYRRVGVGRRRGMLRSAPSCVVTADFASAR